MIPADQQQTAWTLLAHVDAVMSEMFAIPAKSFALPVGDGTSCIEEEIEDENQK